MDKIKFSILIGFIARFSNCALSQFEVNEIDQMIDDGFKAKSVDLVAALDNANNRIRDLEGRQTDMALVNHIVWALAHGKKIEAIKAHRKLTGMGLKESKDAIEGAGQHLESVW